MAREAGVHPMSPDNALAAMVVPALERVPMQVARVEAMIRMARVACALERHRLGVGAHPAALEALVPGYLAVLPADPMGEGTFRYESRPDGTFRLWSVGPDGVDNAGAVTERREEGLGADWVWPEARAGDEARSEI